CPCGSGTGAFAGFGSDRRPRLSLYERGAGRTPTTEAGYLTMGQYPDAPIDAAVPNLALLRDAEAAASRAFTNLLDLVTFAAFDGFKAYCRSQPRYSTGTS
ncbi:MAG TPA: hypothetical protein PLX89_18360, partial [Verrucomicrobiota bacterium]|nr:hypothetical protein [Verrucomicrobiota bacterium]